MEDREKKRKEKKTKCSKILPPGGGVSSYVHVLGCAVVIFVHGCFSALAPVRTPRVVHNPAGRQLRVVGVEADELNRVIEVERGRAARGRRQHAANVVLPS